MPPGGHYPNRCEGLLLTGAWHSLSVTCPCGGTRSLQEGDDAPCPPPVSSPLALRDSYLPQDLKLLSLAPVSPSPSVFRHSVAEGPESACPEMLLRWWGSGAVAQLHS